VSLPPSASYAQIQAAVIAHEHAALEAKRQRRQALRRLDVALDRVELLNRDGGPDAPIPSAISALVVEHGGRLVTTSQEAVDELFWLQRRYLDTRHYPDENDELGADDQVADVVELERSAR
jgi:hypothetical protein